MITYCISSKVDCHDETEYRHRKKIFLLNSLNSEEIDFLCYPKVRQTKSLAISFYVPAKSVLPLHSHQTATALNA